MTARLAAAQDALVACHTPVDCARARDAYRQASDDEMAAINAQLKADDAELAVHLAQIRQLTAALEATAACRRARRWWQLWKRCPLDIH